MIVSRYREDVRKRGTSEYRANQKVLELDGGCGYAILDMLRTLMDLSLNVV